MQSELKNKTNKKIKPSLRFLPSLPFILNLKTSFRKFEEFPKTWWSSSSATRPHIVIKKFLRKFLVLLRWSPSENQFEALRLFHSLRSWKVSGLQNFFDLMRDKDWWVYFHYFIKMIVTYFVGSQKPLLHQFTSFTRWRTRFLVFFGCSERKKKKFLLRLGALRLFHSLRSWKVSGL